VQSRSWPKAPVDWRRRHRRYRGIAVVDGDALNVGKGSMTDERSATQTGSLPIHCDHSRLDGCSALFSGQLE